MPDRQVQPVALALIGAALGAAIAMWFLLLEAVVENGTDLLWNDLVGSDEHRWRVVPTAALFGVAFAALLRALRQPRLPPEEAGGLVPGPQDDDGEPAGPATVARIAGVGVAGLVAGGALGPEAPLVESSAAIGAWISRTLRVDAATAAVLSLACVGALMVAFLDSVLMVALPLALLYVRTRRLPVRAVLVIVLAAAGAKGTLWIVDQGHGGFGSVPVGPDIGAADYPAAAATGAVVAVLALALYRTLRRLRTVAARVDRSTPWWLSGAAFGLVIGLLYLAGGETVQFNGSAGTPMLIAHHAGDRAWILLGLALVKLLVTAWSRATGYRGGLYFPSIYIGVAVSLAIGTAVPAWSGPGVLIGAVAGIFVGLGLPQEPGAARAPYVTAAVTTLLFLVALVPASVIPVAVLGIAAAIVANVAALRLLPRPAPVEGPR